ncbi:MAG: HlyD family type I secretion periplasmic adaptor subunit [Campylobacterota bacterium]|nr:HlyD family type I secretion periplasmic adaptor subunit [Campylobacterota bacterium]
MAKQKFEYSENDYEFMHSLSAAILSRAPSKISRVIYFWLVTIAAFIVWASFAQIDEITRGSGEVIPYGENQIIQNLEGGIVESILVNEGDSVKAGDIVLKIKNTKSTSSYASNEFKLAELKAKAYRLHAEANSIAFVAEKYDNPEMSKLVKLEQSLYLSNKTQFKARDASHIQKIEQKKHELKEAQNSLKHLKKTYQLADEEVRMTEPMVKEGVKSKVDFLRLKRDLNDVAERLETTKLSIPRLKSSIKEARQNRVEDRLLFQNTAKKELNEVTAEIERIKANKTALSDQVDRTVVRSLVDGVVQKLFIHTVGGVIKPGQDLIEIVPSDDTLYLEVKIKPSDIAFIHPGAEAMVKFSAYDFAIHGGLKGKVINITPDTITDEEGDTYYKIHIKTEKSHLGSEEQPLNIITGMTVDVDIITGKKTVMQYILKPILKSKQYVFSER